jgi:hypothetical protein
MSQGLQQFETITESAVIAQTLGPGVQPLPFDIGSDGEVPSPREQL